MAIKETSPTIDQTNVTETPNSSKTCWLRRIFGPKKARVIVLRLAGVIGQKAHGQGSLQFESLREPIDEAFKNKPDLLCLVINSPGGLPGQANLIADRILELSKRYNVPVWSFVEDVAASGGYWLACAGEKIIALESSILGSIGVVASGFGFPKLLEKIGVERRVYTSGQTKNQLDSFLPENQDDIKRIKDIQNDIHQHFIAYVKERRADRLQADDEILFQGDFWSGKKSKELGLVDEIGLLYPTLYAKFGKNVKIKYIQLAQGSFIKRLLGLHQKPLDHLVETIDAQMLWSRYRL